MESLACGVPVVVSDQVAIHREISELAAGLVVPCEPTALAKALGTLLADNSLRIEMGNAARRFSRTKFTLKSTTQQLVTLYQDITTAEIQSHLTPAFDVYGLLINRTN